MMNAAPKWNRVSDAEMVRRLEKPAGKIHVVLDTDTYNEIDDQFALSYMVRSDEKLEVKAIYAAPFSNHHSTGPADGMEKSYQEIAGRFGLVSPATYLHPKPMLVPALMSGVGILGYMGPFFTEYNLNPDLLPVQYPFTYAHEMAHVLGISNEAEANLYGFLACSRSEVPEIRFSAYFGLLPYVLGNAYQLLPEEEFNRWKETISPDVKDAYNRKVAYWQTLYSPTIVAIAIPTTLAAFFNAV